MALILAHGYIAYVLSRKSEAAQKKSPKKPARRWVVEACHGRFNRFNRFNRFRKLLVRYEKLEHTFLALNHLAAAISALRKIELPINIIYGYILTSGPLHRFNRPTRSL